MAMTLITVLMSNFILLSPFLGIPAGGGHCVAARAHRRTLPVPCPDLFALD
jgi:hypothetical protein